LLTCAESDVPFPKMDASMARVFRQKVTALAAAVEREGDGGV
jgi:hypothetical protein